MSAPRVWTVALCLVATLAVGCSERESVTSSPEARRLPHYDSPDFTPRWDVDATDPGLHRIRAFNLVDQRGGAFTERDLAGKIVVADFFFTTCPSICVRLAASMKKLQSELAADDDVLLLSHSVTPDIDTPPVLAAYGETHGVDFSRWKLLTGSQKEIYDLGRRFYFVEEDLGVRRGADEFLHTENFVLVDEHRHLRGIYNGLDPASMKALLEDLRVLQQE